jgi:hypothetical protein
MLLHTFAHNTVAEAMEAFKFPLSIPNHQIIFDDISGILVPIESTVSQINTSESQKW